MIQWETVTGSTRITAWAYIEDRHTILVRLTSGIEWAYEHCKPATWEEFQRTSSPGRYIAEVLNHKPNHEW